MNKLLTTLGIITAITGAVAVYMVWFTVPAHASYVNWDNETSCQVPEVTPSPEVTPTPEDELSPTPDIPVVAQSGYSAPEPGTPPAVCSGSEIKAVPTIVGFKRLGADSVWVDWTPVDEHVHDYIVRYSLGAHFPMWSTKVENATETTLNYLPNWLPIFVSVAGTDNCVLGDFSLEIDP